MANPAAPADVLTMLRSNGGGPLNAATIAPSVSPPPGIGAAPGVTLPSALPAAVPVAPVPGPVASVAADPEVPFDPTAAFKAYIAAGIEANKPAASAQPAPDPQAGAAAPAAAVPVDAAAVRPVALPPAFLGDRTRAKTIQLEWPLQFDGFDYTAIVITRPSAREVGGFFERLAAVLQADPSALVRFPIYRDTTGRPVPDAVMDALDDDDLQTILEDVADFLPRRLRPVPDRTASDDTSTLSDGDTTALTSAA